MKNKINWRTKIIEYKDSKTGYDSFGILTTFKDKNDRDIILGNKVKDLDDMIGVVHFNPLWNDFMVDFHYGAIDGYITPLNEKTCKNFIVI